MHVSITTNSHYNKSVVLGVDVFYQAVLRRAEDATILFRSNQELRLSRETKLEKPCWSGLNMCREGIVDTYEADPSDTNKEFSKQTYL